VTFTGTGLWDMSRIWSGILVAGPCTHIESMRLESITNIGAAGKHVLDVVGVGLTPDAYRKKFVDESGPIGNLYKLIPWHVLSALGFTVTTAVEVREPVIFDEPVTAATCKVTSNQASVWARALSSVSGRKRV
jgi:4-hydroxy-tetrahydrodipicolinate reductase